MHRIVAQRLRWEPGLIDEALRRIEWTLAKGILHPEYAERWRHLLARPIPEIVDAITADTPEMRDLRQTTPFVGVVTEQERQRILRNVND